MVKQWIDEVNTGNYNEIVELAKQPDNIRGFGHVKINSIKKCSLFKSLL
jgi:hypothetical protein